MIEREEKILTDIISNTRANIKNFTKEFDVEFNELMNLTDRISIEWVARAKKHTDDFIELIRANLPNGMNLEEREYYESPYRSN